MASGGRIRNALSGRRPGYHRPRRVGLRSCDPRHGRERHNFHFIKATEVARSCVMDLMFRSEFTGRIMENTMVLCVDLNITDTSRSPGPIKGASWEWLTYSHLADLSRSVGTTATTSAPPWLCSRRGRILNCHSRPERSQYRSVRSRMPVLSG